MNFIKAVLFVVALIPFKSFACTSDYDCQAGSTCLKQGFDSSGICVGGMFSGNRNDKNPYESSTPNSKVGNSCIFDAECDAFHHCAKSGNGNMGTCL